MEQKADIQRAMSRAPDDEKLTLRAEFHSVTSKLYSASGKANVWERIGMVCCGVVWYCTYSMGYGMVWYGTYGMVWYDMA